MLRRFDFCSSFPQASGTDSEGMKQVMLQAKKISSDNRFFRAAPSPKGSLVLMEVVGDSLDVLSTGTPHGQVVASLSSSFTNFNDLTKSAIGIFPSVTKQSMMTGNKILLYNSSRSRFGRILNTDNIDYQDVFIGSYAAYLGIDAKSRIWIGFPEEAVLGDEESSPIDGTYIEKSGLACIDGDGTPLWSLDKVREIPQCLSCESINICDNYIWSVINTIRGTYVIRLGLENLDLEIIDNDAPIAGPLLYKHNKIVILDPYEPSAVVYDGASKSSINNVSLGEVSYPMESQIFSSGNSACYGKSGLLNIVSI